MTCPNSMIQSKRIYILTNLTHTVSQVSKLSWTKKKWDKSSTSNLLEKNSCIKFISVGLQECWANLCSMKFSTLWCNLKKINLKSKVSLQWKKTSLNCCTRKKIGWKNSFVLFSTAWWRNIKKVKKNLQEKKSKKLKSQLARRKAREKV